MGITIRQPGGAKAAARAGSIIGKGQRAQEDRARAEREQVRAAEAKARMKAQQTALDWEVQKMQMRSQKEFEKELRRYDYQLMRDDRAESWAVEKMEIASRMDFEREEQERQRKLGVIDAERATWEKEIKEGRVNENELAYQNAMTDLDARERAAKMDEAHRPGQLAAQQRAQAGEVRTEGRYAMAQDAAARAQAGEVRDKEIHEKRMAAPSKTEEDIERERNEAVLGSWAKDLSLPEQRNELQNLGLVPEQTAQDDNIPYPTPTSQEAYDAIPSGSNYIDSAGRERTKS